MNKIDRTRFVGLRLVGVMLMLASVACWGGSVTPSPTVPAPPSPTAPLVPTRPSSPTLPSAPATAALSASASPGPQCTRANEAAPAASQVHLRVNQVGYLPAESKLALALTDVRLEGQAFNVVAEAGGPVVRSHTVGDDLGTR